MDYLNLKQKLSVHKIKKLLCFVIFGLLIVIFFFGKSRIDIESIAVSPNEKYIAYFETGNGYKIHCFNSDGSMAFTYNIPADISAGGHCVLWFEDDILCALFYRTDKIVRFASSGSILQISTDTTDESHPEFPSFSRRNHQYIFDGNEIDVIYNEGTFLEYWFLGSERYLAITSKSGETKIVYCWTARRTGDGLKTPKNE